MSQTVKRASFMKTHLILLALFLGLLTACDQHPDAEGKSEQIDRSQQTGVRTEVIHSPHRAMGKIPIAHSVLSAQQLGTPITVQIEFTTQADQLIAVEYRPSETLSLTDGVAVDVQSDADGKVSFLVELIATMPGKAYLKLFVYSLDGSMASSTAIALNIADQHGQIPTQQPAASKPRINLPAASF